MLHLKKPNKLEKKLQKKLMMQSKKQLKLAMM